MRNVIKNVTAIQGDQDAVAHHIDSVGEVAGLVCEEHKASFPPLVDVKVHLTKSV